MYGRREFLKVCSAAALAPRTGPAGDGRLRFRVGRSSETTAPGTYPLGLGGGRDGMLFVPSSYQPGRRTPCVLALHGATGSGQRQLEGWRAVAEAHGVIVIAPDSRGMTWDGVSGEFGEDVAFIDRALAVANRRCDMDASRLALAGFSDGASYALSLGIVNGDLFGHVIAFSPGFVVPGVPHGAPEFFVSHGRADRILPIDLAGRRIARQLRSAGFSVLYVEFDGDHTVPPEIREQAAAWMLA
jgi:phospholipase/carboxylesterase